MTGGCFERWSAAILVSATGAGILALLLSAPAVTSAQEQGRDTFTGFVRMTTDATGSWTAVTVSQAPGRPLDAAFVVQWQNPPSAVLDWQGTGTVRIGATSLAVGGDGKNWLFKFPSYGGPVRAGHIAWT